MRIVRALWKAASASKAAAPKEISSYDRFLYKADGFCKYGLRTDDLLSEHSDDVVEALRRLPEDLVNERIFRHNRAAILSMSHSILPVEEWTKIEEDVPYLLPYLREVIAEKEEKKNWEANNPL